VVVENLSFQPDPLEEIESGFYFLDVSKLVKPILLEALLIHGFTVLLSFQ
jgi:hypothetical protein